MLTQRQLEEVAAANGRSACALALRQSWQISPQEAAERFGYSTEGCVGKGKTAEREAFLRGFCEQCEEATQ